MLGTTNQKLTRNLRTFNSIYLLLKCNCNHIKQLILNIVSHPQAPQLSTLALNSKMQSDVACKQKTWETFYQLLCLNDFWLKEFNLTCLNSSCRFIFHFAHVIAIWVDDINCFVILIRLFFAISFEGFSLTWAVAYHAKHFIIMRFRNPYAAKRSAGSSL